MPGDGDSKIQGTERVNNSITVKCVDPEQGHKVLGSVVWPHLKTNLQAGKRMLVIVREETRSLEQNKLLHAVLADISDQVEWYGQKFSADIWKRLCVAAWLTEKNERPILIPSLTGNGVDIIYEKTSKLSTAQCSELIEWCFAFGVSHGVKFNDRSLEDGSWKRTP